MRRWEEIKLRQNRLAAEVEAQATQATPVHMDHIMKGGFTMSDLKGLNRNFNEEAVEADEQMLRLNPSRPSRKGSLSRGSPTFDAFDMGSKMQRSTSALDIDGYQMDGMEDKSDKKRGRSPFKFFKKNRDQSKDKHKSRSPTDRNRGRGTCKPTSLITFEENVKLLFFSKYQLQLLDAFHPQ